MAKKQSTRTLKPIHLCYDRILTSSEKIRAAALARKENPANEPKMPKKLFGASAHPFKMALLTGKRWKKGRVLKVYFTDGSATQKQRVRDHALHWMPYANIKLDFNATRDNSDLRISFKADSGSWSYVGTDNLGISKTQPTMNFGWLRDDTDDQEYERVVVHEFGHALGCIHEHQNPRGGIKWNEDAVYRYFGGPPNNWSRSETFNNVIEKYSVDQLNASNYDRLSIMLYSFPGELIQGGRPTPENTHLSARDKSFIRSIYPKS